MFEAYLREALELDRMKVKGMEKLIVHDPALSVIQSSSYKAETLLIMVITSGSTKMPTDCLSPSRRTTSTWPP